MVHFVATMLQQDRILIPFPRYSADVSIWQQISNALHVSIYRVLSLLIAVLPGILAFFVALGIFALLGKAVSSLLRWILKTFDFDARMARGGEWTSSSSPTALVARIVFWLFVLLGLLIGVSAFDTSYAVGTAMTFSLLPYLAHGVGAILILILGTLIARFLARSVLIGAVNAQLQYARFLSLGVKWLVMVLTAAMALEHLQIGGAIVDLAFSILFGGIVLTLALAVGLGSRELVSRSLESQLDKGERTNPPAAAAQQNPSETIQHF